MNEAVQIEIPPEANKPEVRELINSGVQLLELYQGWVPATPEEYSEAGLQLKTIKAKLSLAEEERLIITRPMDAAKSRVMAFFKKVTDPLQQAERMIKLGMGKYAEEQKRIADEKARAERARAEKEARRLREEARKADELAARKERERLAEQQRKADEQAAAEAARIAEEKAAAKSEADARRVAEQEAAAQRRREEEQERLHRERLASEAAQRERTARAESLEARAEVTTAAPLAPATPKVSGVSTRKKWRFYVTDPALVPDEYKTIDEKKIGGVVRALKGDTNIPGVRVWAETTIAAGSK